MPGDGRAYDRVGVVFLLVSPGIEPKVDRVQTRVGCAHDDRTVVAYPRVIDRERDDLGRGADNCSLRAREVVGTDHERHRLVHRDARGRSPRTRPARVPTALA